MTLLTITVRLLCIVETLPKLFFHKITKTKFSEHISDLNLKIIHSRAGESSEIVAFYFSVEAVDKTPGSVIKTAEATVQNFEDFTVLQKNNQIKPSVGEIIPKAI